MVVDMTGKLVQHIQLVELIQLTLGMKMITGGLAEDWLVTPMFIPDASNNHISFSHRQAYGTDYGSTYRCKSFYSKSNNTC